MKSDSEDSDRMAKETLLTVRRKLANIYIRKSGKSSPSAKYVSQRRVMRWNGI